MKKKKSATKILWFVIIVLAVAVAVLGCKVYKDSRDNTPVEDVPGTVEITDTPTENEEIGEADDTPVSSEIVTEPEPEKEPEPEPPAEPEEPVTEPEKEPEAPKITYVDASDESIYPTVANVAAIDPENPYLILVNPWNKLPEDYNVNLVTRSDGHKVEAGAADDLQEMLNDAWIEGLKPIVCSSYRTNTKQRTLFAREVNSYLSQGYSREDAITEAAKWVANPGTSEHQTGLAVDIVSLNYQVLDKKQEDTPEQKWLMENSYKYGFILRYPSDKSHLTGIYYEPWHYRYVGRETAKAVYESGLCLEEFLALPESERVSKTEVAADPSEPAENVQSAENSESAEAVQSSGASTDGETVQTASPESEIIVTVNPDTTEE